MTIQWWRSWHGAPTDTKWLVIGRKAGVTPGIVSAVFWALCDYASQNKERGSIVGFDVETYSAFTGFSEEDVNSVISALNEKGLVEDGFLVNWSKRQPVREDDSLERVRKYRENKKAVTQGNAPDKDTDKDKEIVIPEKFQNDRFKEVWTKWVAYRKEIKNPLKPTTQEMQLKKLSAYSQEIAIEKLERSMLNGWRGFDFKDDAVKAAPVKQLARMRE